MTGDGLLMLMCAGCTSGEDLVASGGRIMAASQALVAAARESHNFKLASVLIEVRTPLSCNSDFVILIDSFIYSSGFYLQLIFLCNRACHGPLTGRTLGG